MKVLAMVTEYNPFHFGHKHHIQLSKSLVDAQCTIAVMSGSFVQRGEPSIIDKWTKAKMAIDNGVDLVLELPFIFATQSAERFAYGAVSLLDNLKVVDYIAFGSELGQVKPLQEIAKILVEEPIYFKDRLLHYLNLGNSYPVSRSYALRDYCQSLNHPNLALEDVVGILKNPNNILAIEYLKSLRILNSKIKPITIKRIGSSYGDTTINNKISSATGIRHVLLNKGLEAVREKMPSESFGHLVNYTNNHNYFNTLDNYTQIIYYLLNLKGHIALKDLIDMEAGLENRILNKASSYKNMEDLIGEITSKRYTRTRIQRIFIHLMMELSKSTYERLMPHHPAYFRVLAANSKGLDLLGQIKDKVKVPIITKFSHYKRYKNPYLKEIIYFDKKATDLFYIGLKEEYRMNMDYLTSPYIKN